MTRKKLVLVDDDQIFSLTAKINWTDQIYRFDKDFDNGLDAINFLKRNSGEPGALAEVILLDLSMPAMDGCF
jgi:CheY-like chemotaxis protein